MHSALLVRRSLLVTLLAACGGKSHAVKTPAVDDKPDPYMQWHAAQPKSPTQTFRTTKFEPPQQCGQGPYRMVVEASGAKFSEGMSVTICTNHAFKGSISYLTPQQWAKKSESGFGFTQDKHHEKCRVDGVGLVTPVASGGSSSSKPVAGKGTRKADPGAVAAPVAVELHGEVATPTTSRCRDGQQELSVINTDTIGTADATSPVWGKGRVVIEIWSELPNDLSGASFFVQQRRVPDGVAAETWKAYREAHDAWFKGYDDALARSRTAGHKWTTREQDKPTKQPPAARAEVQAPKPSQHASWIPGYWSDSDGWVWSAGFWRVPKEDIEQEKTVEAPVPPPVIKVEPTQPDIAYYTARKAVWTPGYWMWNGAVYVWIGGSWRIPEAMGMTWVAPMWRPSRRGTSVYVPGGFVRLRRR